MAFSKQVCCNAFFFSFFYLIHQLWHIVCWSNTINLLTASENYSWCRLTHAKIWDAYSMLSFLSPFLVGIGCLFLTFLLFCVGIFASSWPYFGQFWSVFWLYLVLHLVLICICQYLVFILPLLGRIFYRYLACIWSAIYGLSLDGTLGMKYL